MAKYDYLKLKIKNRKNEYYLENLKIALINCSNVEFYNYIIAFVKPFLKGKIERNRISSDYSLIMHDSNFKAYIWVRNEDDKLEVIIQITPIIKNTNLNFFFRKVIFDKDLITLIDRTSYENQKEKQIEEKTIFSLFQNSCQINELGENALVCRIITDSETTNEKCLKSIKALRINKNKESIIEEWNSESKENKYFKASHIFTTFEKILNGESLIFNKEEATYSYAINFINNWLKENSNYKSKINEEKRAATKEAKHLVLF